MRYYMRLLTIALQTEFQNNNNMKTYPTGSIVHLVWETFYMSSSSPSLKTSNLIITTEEHTSKSMVDLIKQHEPRSGSGIHSVSLIFSAIY